MIYIGIGALIASDLGGAMRRRGYSHFGVAWLTVMFTCGAHHMVHATHLLAEGRQIGNLDVVSTMVGIPAGVIWALLRLEASRGGRGDRFVRGTPGWLAALGAAHVAAASAVLVAGLIALRGLRYTDPRLLPNVILVVLYIGIGAYLWRGQLRNRRIHGGWSEGDRHRLERAVRGHRRPRPARLSMTWPRPTVGYI